MKMKYNENNEKLSFLFLFYSLNWTKIFGELIYINTKGSSWKSSLSYNILKNKWIKIALADNLLFGLVKLTFWKLLISSSTEHYT